MSPQSCSSRRRTHARLAPLPVIALLTFLLTGTLLAANPPIPELARWESQMVTKGQLNCDRLRSGSMSGGEALNAVYYDGIKVYYQIGNYTGNTSYWDACARAARDHYRDGYVRANNGSVPGFWNFTSGLAMDYLSESRDSISRDTVISLSQNAAYARDSTSLSSTVDATLSREVAYAIRSYLDAERVGAARRSRLSPLVDQAIGHIDQWFVTKNYRCPSNCDPAAAAGQYYIQPFMVALTALSLIQYYDVTQDSRVLPNVKLAMDAIWNIAWVADNQAFWYDNWTSNASTAFPAKNGAPDLNLLIAPVFGWLYMRTGERIYRDRGDMIFAGGVRGAYLDGGKQFDQNYISSFDYLKWRNAGIEGAPQGGGGAPPPPPPPPAPPAPPPAPVPASGIVAHFQFDEASGSSAADSSGVGNGSLLLNGAAFAAGKSGNALSLDGIDDLARTDATSALNLSASLTMAAWVKPSALASGLHAYNAIAIKGDAAANRGFGMNVRSGKLNFVKLGPGADDVTSAVAVSSGVFQHVAITWDAAADEVRFYKDGVLAETIVNSPDIAAPMDADDLTIGAWLTGGAHFDGLIDDLRIYNRVLSASELAAIVGASTPPPVSSSTAPIAHLKFDETAGITAGDSSGFGNAASLSGGASFAEGRLGNALSLDGIDDSARINATSGLNLSAQLTLSAWIKPDALASGLNGYNTIAVKGDAAASRGFGLNLRDGKLNFVKLGPGASDVTSTLAASTGAFQHVAATWDAASDKVEFYKDGVLIQTIVNAPDIAAPADDDDLAIGAWLTGGSFFDGLIDDFRIYNRALSQSEIAALAAGSAGSTDVNGDGTTNVADVQLAVNQALGAAPCASGDVNGDGACSVTDIQLIVNRSLGL